MKRTLFEPEHDLFRSSYKKFLEQLSAFNAAAGNRYSVNSGYRSIAHQQQLSIRWNCLN